MLVATDVETTGLRPEDGHQLLEIQVYLLEDKYPFKQIGTGFHRYIQHDPTEVRALANDFVKAMHDETKLWSKLEQGYSLSQVDEALLDYLQRHVPKQQGRIMGNSIRLDMNFMDAYLPRSMNWLHYRFLDVTGLSWFAYENFNVPFYEKKPGAVHTADHDVSEAIAELRHVTEGLNTARNVDVKVMRSAAAEAQGQW